MQHGTHILAEAPRYSRGERIADAVVHGIGLLAALLACAVLGASVPWTAGLAPPLAIGAYAVGLLAMLGCSALHTLAGTAPRRALLAGWTMWRSSA